MGKVASSAAIAGEAYVPDVSTGWDNHPVRAVSIAAEPDPRADPVHREWHVGLPHRTLACADQETVNTWRSRLTEVTYHFRFLHFRT